MCTTIAVGNYFGRNMDLDCSFGERVVITPRRYRFDFRQSAPLTQHYAMIGMAAVADGYPLYADAANEKGLCMAGLNFPGNAYYSDSSDPQKYNISPFELIPWLLGQCATLDGVRELLEQTHLVAIPFAPELPLTPLHWHIADGTGSIVLESTQEGLRIYEDLAGVLTNNPPFPFHLANLAHYATLTNQTPPNESFVRLGSNMFGMGLGSFGLPGDYSSTSRFVKAAWLRQFGARELGEQAVTQLFHMLASVSPVKGAVLTADGKEHYTTYSCCIDAARGVYYYRTYFHLQIQSVNLHQVDLNADSLTESKLTASAFY